MFNIIYYTENEKSPIVEFMLKLPPKDRAKILREIDLLEKHGFALGMPSIRKMKGTDNLWELRIKQSSNNYRFFYFQHIADTFILLHAIHKKTQKTPKRDIDTAIRRMNKYIKGSENNVKS